MERTWEITDINGTRTVTLAQFRAEMDARKAMAAPIMAALRKGDLAACEKAQKAMRKAFA